MTVHKIEEWATSRGLVMVSCVCGWVHAEPKGWHDREKCREAMRQHKAEARLHVTGGGANVG